MKNLINKTLKILDKYNTEICATLLTIIFCGMFTIVLLEVINQAFVTN